jgi:hypothetical protein
LKTTAIYAKVADAMVRAEAKRVQSAARGPDPPELTTT